MKTDSVQYAVNEIFYSVQGEGVRAGTANVFIRFAGCNLTCSRDGEAGFDCDTEFTSARKMTAAAILSAVSAFLPCKAIIFTGGEPALQLTASLCDMFKSESYFLAIETNGTYDLSAFNLDWITVSPKTAEHTLRQKTASEVKYVRRIGQGIPRPQVKATHRLISPACQADGVILPADLAYCIDLIKEFPEWRLSTQQHKLWKVR